MAKFDVAKFIAGLPELDSFDNDLNEIKVKPRSFIDKDSGLVAISTEAGDSAADYYGEYRGGFPWINPSLVKYAEDNNGYWEWRDPSAIVFCQN